MVISLIFILALTLIFITVGIVVYFLTKIKTKSAFQDSILVICTIILGGLTFPFITIYIFLSIVSLIL